MSWTIASLSLLLLLLSLAPSLTVAQGNAEDDEKNFYSRRYDSIDVETIFRSSRLLNNYVDCLLDKKPCPPEGKELKRILPHALRTKCVRCTKIQKLKALDVISRLYYQHPSIYIALAERYDPRGEYTKNFENWFDEQNGIKPRPQIPDLGEPLPDVPSSEGQQFSRRSPSLADSASSSSVNNFDYSQRTRIPSSWITTTTTTTQKPSTTRAPLRTTVTPPIRITKMSTDRVNAPTTTRAPVQPPSFLFARPESNPISQSINKLLDTTGKVVNNFADMFRTTLEILAG